MSVMHWLTGWVRFQVVTPQGGERFLNGCTRAGLILWQVRPGKKGITACVRANQYHLLRVPARRAKIRLHILRRGGLPLKLNHLRNRPGLAAGFCLFWAVLIGLGQCFWTVEVGGCQTVSETALRASLAAQGVAPGKLKKGFCAKEIQLKIMEQFPQISWISINNHGGDIDVHLTEKDSAPPVADQTGWYQLRASQSGRIVEVHVTAGTAVVHSGDGVVRGQLLASAVVENKDEKFMRLYHAAGTVTAETKHTLQVTVPLDFAQWEVCGDSAERSFLQIFGMQIPLSIKLPPQGQLRRSGEVTVVRLCGKELPVSLMREELTPVRSAIHHRSRQQAEQQAKQLMAAREKSELAKAQITQRHDTVKVSAAGVTITRQFACRENIAEEVKISQ